MSKKAVNIAALLFANIILLANTVVPHHHHENAVVCFFLHCRDSKEAHHHEHHNFPEHDHDGNPFFDKCIVDDNYVPADNNKKFVDCLPAVKCDYEQAIAYCCFVSAIAANFQQKPYLPQLYSEFITLSIGLRAPPIDF